MEQSRSNCVECTHLIRLCGGLDYFPADAEVRKLLVERLHRCARSHDHAKAMIDRWLETQTAAPKVADLVSLAGEVRITADKFPEGCSVCHGEPWVLVDNPGFISSVKRCSCARGQAFRAKDRAREEERQSRTAA